MRYFAVIRRFSFGSNPDPSPVSVWGWIFSGISTAVIASLVSSIVRVDTVPVLAEQITHLRESVETVSDPVLRAVTVDKRSSRADKTELRRF